MYRTMGRLHADMHQALVTARARLADDAGQGTIEYVGLIMLLAVVLGAVVVAGRGLKDAGIAETIVGKLKDSIEGVGGGK